MATTQKGALSPRMQRAYNAMMSEWESWTDDKTRESIIETQQRIARYEREHRMSSAEMRRKVIAGEIDETLEICDWSLEIDSLDRVLREFS